MIISELVNIEKYNELPNNVKSYINMFFRDHNTIVGDKPFIISELKNKYFTYINHIPEMTRYAKSINYDMMYNVHIAILADCLDVMPFGIYKRYIEDVVSI